MASRMKEDDKNERIIRGLIKQPGNRKCINCNVLGPQYVCITFSTFVCTTCGGIHREFTHRVKSVSMAKFTPQEIASLQAGGNERAKEIFFKDWDSQQQRAPDSSNVDKLRNFIKHVYVDRRYTGERNSDKTLQGDKEEPNENKKSDPYRSGSRSPPFDDERRYSDRPSPGHDVRGSPGYYQDNQRHSDYGRSPIRPGIVSDWRREDRFSDGRRPDDCRSSDGELKSEIRSPDSQTDSSISSPPVARPVRDILGENAKPLRISEPPKASGSRVAVGAAITQRAASSSSLAPSSSNPTERRRGTSLIDFDTFSEPVTQIHQSVVAQSNTPSTSTPSDDNWACFDNATEEYVSQTPSTNPLESMLSGLSVRAPTPVSGLTNVNDAPTPSNDTLPSSSSGNFLFDSLGSTSTTALPADSVTSSSSYPSGDVPVGHSLAPTMHANGGNQWRGMQRPQQPSTVAINQPGAATMPANVGNQWRGMQSPQQPSTVAINQPGAAQLVSAYPSSSSTQEITGNSVAQAPHPFGRVTQAVSTPSAQPIEAKASGRQALPADLFTVTYPSIPYGHYQTPGWQTGMLPGMRIPMQYNTAMSMPTYLQPIKSANPFDVNAEASPSQAATFPSVSSLHMALPNMAAPGGSGARPSWMPPQQSFYPSATPPHGPTMPGPYMGQQLHNNMAPSRPQGFGRFGGDGTALGSVNPATSTQNHSVGRNPFG
ncbi:hypothetical protein RND81_07G101600 [Saponaria officinalis]|uniref:Arf-GAP domain-containing protein n=1 Tax=Saponaria officinalis TaxID=3572 RepID=A0AAW1JP93_SAPOF